ncbi:hypothetical protein SLS62_001812 [Diatrype stigma]|uniref:Ankyrin n=1 Tax=Diatrype stigma TaxID=117547 RepID=A0AAN9UVA8_9PEZI
MPSLITLPTEIVKIIIEQFDRCRDVFACMRLCRRLFLIARRYIFRNAQPLHRILYWAIQANQRETVRAVLEAGANAAMPMMVHHRRLALLRTEPPARFYAQWPRRPLSPHSSPPYTSRYSALHLAVREGQLGLLKVLLQHGHPIDAASCHFCCVPWRTETRLNLPWHDWFQYHLTPLHTALCFGQSEIAQFLVKSGASIHGREFAYQNHLIPGGPVRTGATALHLACGCGDLPTAKFLIKEEYIKEIDVQDVRGYSPLWYAFIQRKWDCFEWLLSQGANLNLCVPRLPTGGPLAPRNSISVDYYTSLLDYAISCMRFDDALMLINVGINIHITMSRFRNPLHSCCSTRGTDPHRLAVITKLLDSKLDINSRVLQGCTPMLTAVAVRDLQAIQLLIQRGADLDLKLDDGTPALWLACSLSPDRKNYAKNNNSYLRGASPEIVRMLLEAGARIYELRLGGRNLLQHVCSSLPSPEKAAIVRLLVRHTRNFDSDVESVRDLVYSCFVTGDDDSLKAVLERIVSSRLWTSKADILQLFRLTMGRPNIGCLKYLLSIDVENYILWEPTNAPPCAVHDMIEYSIILGAANCTSVLQGTYPKQMEYLLSRNAETYLLKLLLQFSSAQEYQLHPDPVFRGSLADSAVDTMSLLLEHDGNSDHPSIDLEARRPPSRIPLAYNSIIEVIQEILTLERVHVLESNARLRAYRAFSRRVSIYWTATEPEIMIAPGASSSQTTSGSASPVSPSPPASVLGGGYDGAADLYNNIHNYRYNHHNFASGSSLPGTPGGPLPTALLRALHPSHLSSPLGYHQDPPGMPSSDSPSSSRSLVTAESGSDTASTSSSDNSITNNNTDSDASSRADSAEVVDS